MKQKVASTGFAVVFALSLMMTMVAPVYAQGTPCSLARAAGNWGLTLSGTLILPTGPVPAVAVVNATLDSEGNASGTEGRSVGGSYADETFSGNLSANPDCTGAATLKFYEDGQLVRTSVLTIVFDDNSKEMRMVQKSLALPDGTTLPVVITVEGRKR